MPLLDTSVLIDIARGNRTPHGRRAEAFLSARPTAGETLFTSRVNEAEFRVGSYRAADRARETLKIEAVLASVVILELDAAGARRFAAAKARLLSIGRPTGDMDVLIAAVALTNGLAVVTRNPSHFADVPELAVLAY